MKKIVAKGYTLFELMLAIALISIISLEVFPISISFLQRNEYDSVFRLTVSAIRNTQILSQTGKNNSAWGISFQSSQLIVYSGNTFASRNASFDESTPKSTKVNITGASEINFTKYTEEIPTSTTITISGNSISKNITVNTKGLVIY